MITGLTGENLPQWIDAARTAGLPLQGQYRENRARERRQAAERERALRHDGDYEDAASADGEGFLRCPPRSRAPAVFAGGRGCLCQVICLVTCQVPSGWCPHRGIPPQVRQTIKQHRPSPDALPKTRVPRDPGGEVVAGGGDDVSRWRTGSEHG